jgi:3-oxoacyl-(acyl-carrier-protein) synthase/acyl carrier protein
MGKIFEQGHTNYQFKKKFGVAGEPLFAYLPADVSFPSILQYWSVFYENSLSPPQLSERLRKGIPSACLQSRRFESPEERQAAWDRAERFEKIPYSDQPLDLMTDTWFGRESEAVQKRVEFLKTPRAAESPNVLAEIFPFKHLIFTPQGRDAEALFYGSLPKTKRKILSAIPWTSTLVQQLSQGFEVIELPARGVVEGATQNLFQGEIDLEAVKRLLETDASSIALAGLEVLSNGTGGHPVRISHARQLKSLLNAQGIPLVLDASRVVRNAVLLQRYDPEAKTEEVWPLVRQMLAQADYVVTSLTKDFGTPVGGLIATNDDALAARIRELQATQGAARGGEEQYLRRSLADRGAILEMMAGQLDLVKSLQDRLSNAGIPLFGPACGHAIVIDAGAYLPEPVSKDDRVKFLRELFIQTGIRAGVHQAGQQRQGRLARGIRLAFPLGLARAHEEEIFSKLQSFLAARMALPPLETSAVKGAILPAIDMAESRGESMASPGDIAIIGLNGRFPGADNHYDFWAGLQRGESFVREVPPERWDHQEYYAPGLPKAFVPHKTRCKYGAFLRGHDWFDAAFFQLSAAEVVMMDPQERLALEVAWGCLEDAGYTPEGLGRDVGLFSGVTYNEYQKLIPRTTHSCFLTSRLAYFFNFHGPAAALDTGCSSSLAAMDAACQNLRAGRCRAALVIGSNVILHPDHYASLSPELSTAQRPESTPFGDGDGWIPAEGVVAVLLKPLNEAIRDRDHIYASIKSSAMGHEGKTSWFSAFSPRSQADFLQRSFEQAGISPATIGYVEAAANGSPLGDAIELEGLSTAFRKWTQQAGYCPIGTVKSNAGHGEGVSTLLQLTKLLLQFQAGEIYPLLYPERRNPALHLAETPFRIPTETEAWQRPQFQWQGHTHVIPRRATISSFGGGGNMGHLILEEAPPSPLNGEALASYFVPLSARTPEQLRRAVAELLSFFDKIETLGVAVAKEYRLLDIMHTLCRGRVSFGYRLAFVVADLNGLKDKCQRYLRNETDPDIIAAAHGETAEGRANIRELLAAQSWRELGERWVQGAEIPWGDFFELRQARRVPLPSYSFDRQRHEISTDAFLRAYAPPGPQTTLPPQLSVSNSKGTSDALVRVVKTVFSQVLAVEAGALDLTLPLEQYGFDSALVVKAAAELEKYYRHVPPTLFFDCRTLGDVVEYLCNAIPVSEVVDVERLRQGPETDEPPSQTDVEIRELAEGIMSQRLTAGQVLEKLGLARPRP